MKGAYAIVERADEEPSLLELYTLTEEGMADEKAELDL
jgi:hypothetical protein